LGGLGHDRESSDTGKSDLSSIGKVVLEGHLKRRVAL
jgi:hypothetical protein